MAFTKRRKQPHLYRDRSVDPTKQVAAQLEAQSVERSKPVTISVSAKSKRKRAATKH